MTDELRQIIERLYEAGPIKISFSHYYKYTFTYEGENEFIALSCSYGGVSDEIYRHNVDAEPFMPGSTLLGLEHEYYYIHLRDKKTGKRYKTYHFSDEPEWEEEREEEREND